MESVVTVRRCGDYDSQLVRATVGRIVDDLGGMRSWIKTGDRVLLKPNLLMSAVPEKAVVTHPAIVEAVASLVFDMGATPFIGDSPPLGNLNRVLSKSGYGPFMKKMGIEAVPFTRKVVREFGEARLYRRIDLAGELFDFDVVINLPKLKTHGQMVLTLAVKNLFGAVIGTDKASWHLRAGRDVETFAEALVQIYESIRPALSILDGILGMEGNGPNSGEPRHVGIIAASEDAVALDAVVCSLVGYPVEVLRTCVVGERLRVGVADIRRITVEGDDLKGFPLKRFEAPKSVTMTWNVSRRNPVLRFLQKHMVTRPDIDPAACRACGICLKHCPPQAITDQGSMTIDRDKCISCFCCHELCPNDAVRIRTPFIGRILGSMTR